MTTCEACRVAEATERVDDAPEVIYSVCIPCAHRLQQRSLRPREWLHLASLHGAQAFLLHDDFYDDDGTAAQPEAPVEDAASDPFPDREAWERDPRLAFHVGLVKWALPEEIVAVLRRDGASTLSLLWAISTRAHGAAACELAARVLGADAADWARERGAANDLSFWSLGRVCAACLPREEGLRVMSDAIERAPPEHRPDAVLGLSSFHDPAVLALVGGGARRFPASDSRGRVAARTRSGVRRDRC